MDPDKCLTETMQLLFEGSTERLTEDDRSDLVEHLRNLADWLEKGGAPPSNVFLATPTGYRVP